MLSKEEIFFSDYQSSYIYRRKKFFELRCQLRSSRSKEQLTMSILRIFINKTSIEPLVLSVNVSLLVYLEGRGFDYSYGFTTGECNWFNYTAGWVRLDNSSQTSILNSAIVL